MMIIRKLFYFKVIFIVTFLLVTSCKHLEIKKERKVSIGYQILTPALDSPESIESFKQYVLGRLKTLAVKGFDFTIDDNGVAYIDDSADENYLSTQLELNYLDVRLDNNSFYLAERGELIFYEIFVFRKQYKVSVQNSYMILEDLLTEVINAAKLPNNFSGVIKLANTININDLDLEGEGSFYIIPQ